MNLVQAQLNSHREWTNLKCKISFKSKDKGRYNLLHYVNSPNIYNIISYFHFKTFFPAL